MYLKKYDTTKYFSVKTEGICNKYYLPKVGTTDKNEMKNFNVLTVFVYF